MLIILTRNFTPGHHRGLLFQMSAKNQQSKVNTLVYNIRYILVLWFEIFKNLQNYSKMILSNINVHSPPANSSHQNDPTAIFLHPILATAVLKLSLVYGSPQSFELLTSCSLIVFFIQCNVCTTTFLQCLHSVKSTFLIFFG